MSIIAPPRFRKGWLVKAIPPDTNPGTVIGVRCGADLTLTLCKAPPRIPRVLDTKSHKAGVWLTNQSTTGTVEGVGPDATSSPPKDAASDAADDDDDDNDDDDDHDDIWFWTPLKARANTCFRETRRKQK